MQKDVLYYSILQYYWVIIGHIESIMSKVMFYSVLKHFLSDNSFIINDLLIIIDHQKATISFLFSFPSCFSAAGVCGAFRWSHGGGGQRPGWQEQCCLQVPEPVQEYLKGVRAETWSTEEWWDEYTDCLWRAKLVHFRGVTCDNNNHIYWSCDECFLHRMDDKGEVKCIKFSIGNKILAVQRTSKSVVSLCRGRR